MKIITTTLISLLIFGKNITANNPPALVQSAAAITAGKSSGLPKEKVKSQSSGSNLKLPFQNRTTRSIWVAPVGTDDANGSKSKPLRTIQAAVKMAAPGTAILVKAGTYTEHLDLNGLHGKLDKPIILKSVDGIGKAQIIGPRNNAAVSAFNISYVGIYGFSVQANADSSAGDVGGFKLMGPWENPAQNLVIAGNIITGQGRDGFKLFNGAKNCLIIGNIINGTWEQEAIDNVSVESTTYAYNTILGKTNYTGITMKAGSRDMQVFGNLFDLNTYAAIYIGGIGSSRFNRSFPDYWKGFEGKNIQVHHNVVTEKIRGKSAVFVAANNSVLENNYLARIVGSRNHTQAGHFIYHSFDNKILNNTVASPDFFKPDSEEEAKGFVISGNRTDNLKPVAGADSPEAKKFLAVLGLK